MSNKTALKEFIEDILSGKVIDTLANKNYYLEKERTQIIDFHVNCVKEGTEREDGTKFSKKDEKLVRKDAEQYFNNTYKKD